MKKERLGIVCFAPKGKDGFYNKVKARVQGYFKSNNISQYASIHIWIKTAIGLGMSGIGKGSVQPS